MLDGVGKTISFLSFLVLTSNSAFAQDRRDNVGDDQSDDPIPPIIVTGQKTDRSLQQTTDSVRVLTADELRREPARDLSEAINRVANASSTVGQRSFAIRGVDQRGISGRGSTLIVFVDDSPLGNRTIALGPTDVWDLAQIEVFRGPQSTNFGRSALAGGIYIRTRDPDYDWSLDTRSEFGEAAFYQAAIAGGGPIIDDRLAFRVAVNRLESNGFITNTFLDADANPNALTSGRFKLLFEPTPQVSVISTTSYTDNSRGENSLRVTNGNPGNPLDASEIRREVAYDLPGREKTKTFVQSINAAWDIRPNLQLRLISTFQDTNYKRQLDGDNTPDPFSESDRTGHEQIITQELRLAYAGDGWAGVVGAYLYDLDETQTDDFFIPFGFFVPGVPFDVQLARDSDLSIATRNYAAFAEGEVKLLADLDLLFGLRYDYEELETASTAVTTSVAPLPPGFGFLNGFFGSESEIIDASYDAWLPKLGLRWRISEDANLSFVVQRAYQAGGGVFDVIDGRVNEFGPEHLWNYELGLRTLWLDGRLRVNANAFYADWSDQQIRRPRPDFPFVFSVENVGESTLWGFEADVSFDAGNDFQIYGALGYSHTEFDDFPNDRFNPTRPVSPTNLPDFNGNRFPFSPRWSANAGIAYDPDDGVFGGIDFNYRSSQFNSSANLPINQCCERATVNARLGYAWSNVRISLIARNLFDDEFYTFLTAATPGAEFGVLGDPQTFAVRLDSRF